MQNILAPRSAPSFGQSMFSHAPAATDGHHHDAQEGRTDHQFIAMLDSYRDSGGIARAQEVVALFKRRCGSDLATLASWIVNKKVICFEWQSRMWLPLFQFNRCDMTPQAGLGQVLAELTSVYDAWELASWFAQPNPWLGDRAPADMLGLDLPAVLNASRADRFMANEARIGLPPMSLRARDTAWLDAGRAKGPQRNESLPLCSTPYRTV